MQGDDGRATALEWNELWRTVSESLLGGIHHALNNRVAALSAISQVLGAGMPDAGPIVASLRGEVNRLEQTVALISLLRRARSRNPEPVQLPELVASLTPLLPHHGDMKETEFVADPDPGVLPVLVERDQLTRVMLVLMTSVGLSAECAGGARVHVSYRGDADEVVTRIECEPAPRRPGGPSATEQGFDAAGAGEVVRAMRGRLERLPSGDRAVPTYEVRLPTLLAARRGEGAASL
jgi:hypothetical protein